MITPFTNYSVKMSDLTKKKTGPFVWTDEANAAFETSNLSFSRH